MKFENYEDNNSEFSILSFSNKGIKLLKTKKRASSFELLRIFLIILIVLHHIFINTNSLQKINMNNFKKIIFWKYIILKILSNYGQFGNNAFIMISGYFSVTKTNFNIYKFLNFIFEIYTYYYPSLFLGKKLRNKYKNLKFPNYFNNMIYFPILGIYGNWFIQIYLSLLLFFPYINVGLLNLNKQKYKNLVFIIVIFYCILNPLTKFYGINSIIFRTTPLITLLLPYIIGGYIKIYDLNYKYFWTIIAFIYFPLTIISEIIFDNLSLKFNSFNFIIFHLNLSISMNSILSIFGSIGIIYLFKNIKFYSKKINFIAASVLGIYLIHGNKHVSPYIYNILFETNNINDSLFFAKYIIKTIFIIGLSIIIDIIRRCTIGLLFEKLIKIVIKFVNEILSN